jgi:hypothetical protein
MVVPVAPGTVGLAALEWESAVVAEGEAAKAADPEATVNAANVRTVLIMRFSPTLAAVVTPRSATTRANIVRGRHHVPA